MEGGTPGNFGTAVTPVTSIKPLINPLHLIPTWFCKSTGEEFSKPHWCFGMGPAEVTHDTGEAFGVVVVLAFS